jgi:hypothetical protein
MGKNFEIENPCVFSHDSEGILELKQLKVYDKYALARFVRQALIARFNLTKLVASISTFLV